MFLWAPMTCVPCTSNFLFLNTQILHINTSHHNCTLTLSPTLPDSGQREEENNTKQDTGTDAIKHRQTIDSLGETQISLGFAVIILCNTIIITIIGIAISSILTNIEGAGTE